MPKYDVNNCAVSSLLASIKAEEIAIPEIVQKSEILLILYIMDSL